MLSLSLCLCEHRSRHAIYWVHLTIPFAATESQRNATGDPRPSIAERYVSKDDYLNLVRHEAEKLVEERYLLEEDIEYCIEQAEKLWSHFVPGK